MQHSPSGSNRAALSIISDRINKIRMTKVQKNLVNPVKKSSSKFFLTVFLPLIYNHCIVICKVIYSELFSGVGYPYS